MFIPQLIFHVQNGIHAKILKFPKIVSVLYVGECIQGPQIMYDKKVYKILMIWKTTFFSNLFHCYLDIGN